MTISVTTSCEHTQPVHIRTPQGLSWQCMDCGEPLLVYLVDGETTYGDALQYVEMLKSRRSHKDSR